MTAVYVFFEQTSYVPDYLNSLQRMTLLLLKED